MFIRLILIVASSMLSTLAEAAAAEAGYELPALGGEAQDKPFRMQSEMAATGSRVLEGYADRTLAGYGLLDVTKAPYLAKGDGKADDTKALQRALKDARDARLVTWLPAGTYLVSDTLQCVQNSVEPKAPTGTRPEERLRANDYPCMIQGPSAGARAVIRLTSGAAGFGEPNHPKPLLLLWTRSWFEPYELKPNMGYNQAAMSLDLDIRGNAGAIGLDVQGAQGTVVEDVTVDAAGAFAGMRGLQGSGGSTSQLTVRGGQYGVYAVGIGNYKRFSGSQPAPLLTHATLQDQTAAAIEYSGRGPLTVVGASIRGAGILCHSPGPPYDGGLNVIDSVIEIAGAGPAIRSDRPVYLNRSYFRGSATLVALGGGSDLKSAGPSWTQVDEFAGAPAGPFPVWIDGKKQSSALAKTSASANPPPGDLLARHALPLFPNWSDPGVANARQAPYSAKGDGRSDDTAALQRAIDNSRVVFVPKGRYKISRPLHLRADSIFFGVNRVLAEITPIADAPAFSDAKAPNPLLETVDSATATAVLGFVQLRSTIPGAYALRWLAGGQSAVRDVGFVRWPTNGVMNHAFLLIEGNGGGRWFNVENSEATDESADYRHQLVRGTRQPLAIYMLNIEHARSEVMTEFIDTMNVSIYSVKGETVGLRRDDMTTRPLIRFRNSRNFALFGLGGVAGVAEGYPSYIVDLDNCTDFVIANFGHQNKFTAFASPANWGALRDNGPDRQNTTSGAEHFVAYRRGALPPRN